MGLNMILTAVNKHKKEMNDNMQVIALKNTKGETVLSLKRFDTNTWLLNPGTKNEEIVKIVLAEDEPLSC